MIQELGGGGAVTPRIGLGYVPFQPMKILGRHKEEQSLIQYITKEEANNEGGDQATSSLKASVFDRLQLSMSQRRPYVFNRIGKDKAPKLSVF